MTQLHRTSVVFFNFFSRFCSSLKILEIITFSILIFRSTHACLPVPIEFELDSEKLNYGIIDETFLYCNVSTLVVLLGSAF